MRKCLVCFFGLMLAASCARGEQRPAVARSVPAAVTVRLTDGAVLHLAPIPLSRFAGVIVGDAHFDATGTRALIIGAFPGSALDGDWRHLDPSQAYLLDLGRRSLRQLTRDGLATRARWLAPNRVVINDGSIRLAQSVGYPARTSVPAERIAAYHQLQDSGDADVTPSGVDRIAIFRRAGGTYAVTQIGAQILHVSGVAANGSYAIIGTYAAWIDRDPASGFTIAREGPDTIQIPIFAGSSYGDAVTPILPLGHSVYQGAYRNGMAYFAFRYGIKRIVGSTPDLVNFSFPLLPKDPAYTLGDGLGAGADGIIYFAGPENSMLQYWHGGRYVSREMVLPAGASDMAPLTKSMQRFDALEPPLRPDADALDAALLQWRVYPVGDETGPAWVASYLGRVYSSDASLHFHVTNPVFPFAVIGRTDDGRLWGASPLARTVDASVVATSASALWSSRDGVHWRLAAQLDGDAGAVGLSHRVVWVALTREWLGRPMIALARLDDFRPASAITGGSYAGEQLFFAALRNGFYLIWGATPAMRLNADEGSLSAFRIDAGRLFAADDRGLNAYMRERLDPASDPSLPHPDYVTSASAVLQPTLDAFARLPRAEHPTLVSRIAADNIDPRHVTQMSPDQERAYEVKYGERPYPVATVDGIPRGNSFLVTRTLAFGPLHAQGTRERWTRAANGVWTLQAVIARWSY